MPRKCQDPLKVVGRAKGYSKKELIYGLRRHSNFSPKIVSAIKKLPEEFLRNSGSALAKKLISMMREVSKEAYRAKQFTRTEINNRGVLYGVVNLKHKVMDIVLNYFHERWPKCVICLYNEHSHKTAIINEIGKIWEEVLSLQDVVQNVSEKRPINPYFDDIQFSGNEIFEEHYKSQFIAERENPKYFNRMIPNYCYDLPGMRNGIEKRFYARNKNIFEFF